LLMAPLIATPPRKPTETGALKLCRRSKNTGMGVVAPF
jgi:hypothetical protein